MRTGGSTSLSTLSVAALALICIAMVRTHKSTRAAPFTAARRARGSSLLQAARCSSDFRLCRAVVPCQRSQLSSSADAAPSHPSHAAQAAARAEAGARDAAAQERRESLAHALSELNRIAAEAWPGAPDSHAAHPPVYALHAVHSYSVVASQGDLVQRVPVYRTVRGYDEKKRRPVLYQTLVHEERLQRVVVDRSATMHLVLRRRSAEELAAAARDRAADRAHECVASEEPSCAPAQQPDPSALLHALMTVATDYEGHRATTMLRSASVEEVAGWWAAFLALGEHGEHRAQAQAQAQADPRATSAVYAAKQDSYLRAHAAYLRPIHARLQGQPPYVCPPDEADAGSLTAMSVNIWSVWRAGAAF